MKKTLPSLRISEEDLENIKSAIKKMNQRSYVTVELQHFRRIALRYFANEINSGKKIMLGVS